MMLTLCRACGMYRVATVGDREHCLHCGDLRAVQPLDPGPDGEADLDAEMSFRQAPPRRRHRHSREEVRELARRYQRRMATLKRLLYYPERTINDPAVLPRRYIDLPWWSKRDRHHGLLLQKGKRP